MRLDDRYVPDPACFLQAISETDGRLSLSARPPVRLVLKAPDLHDGDLMQEGLKVIRKLTARLDALLEAKKAEPEGGMGANL